MTYSALQRRIDYFNRPHYFAENCPKDLPTGVSGYAIPTRIPSAYFFKNFVRVVPIISNDQELQQMHNELSKTINRFDFKEWERKQQKLNEALFIRGRRGGPQAYITDEEGDDVPVDPLTYLNWLRSYES